jgi:phosphoribosylformylglycinamidine cyclo-ligase
VGFYSGKHQVTDPLPESPINIGKALLSPTRTFLPVVNALIKEGLKPKAILHCTGGGQSKIKKFLHHHQISKFNLFEENPLFKLIRNEGFVELTEMLKTFNCGHRMEMVYPATDAEKALEIISTFHLEARITGEIESTEMEKTEVKINYGGRTFTL